MAHASRPSDPQPARAAFQPYIPATQSPAEFTAKAIVLGALFGLIFGASTVYLGLRAGLTVSASIPIAVLAISVLKRFGGSTILENNIVQTIGSAGESVAAGVVFTDSGADLLRRARSGLFQLLPDHDARLRRRHPRRADDGAAAARAHRQGARRPAVSRRHRLRRRPRRRRTRRRAGQDRVHGPRRRRALEGAVVDRADLPDRDRPLDRRGPASSRTPRSTSTSRRSTWASATSSGRGLPASCSPAACSRGWCCCRCFSIFGNYLTVPFPPVPASGLRIDQMTPGPAVERLHPLHRRRRGARRRPDHAGTHHPDDRVVVPRQHPRLQREVRSGAAACRAPSGTCR